MKRKLKYLSACLVVATMMNVNPVKADVNSNSEYYLYDYWGEPYYSAPLFENVKMVDANDYLNQGIRLDKITDIFYENNQFYLLDASEGNEKIVILDKSFNYISTISTFNNGDKLSKPQSLYIRDGLIYIADTGNGRVVVLDQMTHELKTIIGKPEGVPGLEKKATYEPTKIAVDNVGRIYMIVNGIYEGILEVDIEGNFYGFKGVNKVKVDFVDLFWYQFMTKEQREQTIGYLPTQFANIDVDENGFIYTVTRSDSKEPIKKFNLKSEDVLKFEYDFARPSGDYMQKSKYGTNVFVSIAINDYGIYAALDEVYGRIFLYDENGNMLGILGNNDELKKPSEIIWVDDDLVVIDSSSNRMKVYTPTEYGKIVLNASKSYYDGDLHQSSLYWEEALKQNSNFELAYTGIGKIKYREGQYKEAMEYFQLGQSRSNYTRAFEKYRGEMIKQYLPVVFFVGTGAVILYVVKSVRRSGKKGQADVF